MASKTCRRIAFASLGIAALAIILVVASAAAICWASHELINGIENHGKWNATDCDYKTPEICCECTADEYGHCCEMRTEADDSSDAAWCLRSECEQHVSVWLCVVVLLGAIVIIAVAVFALLVLSTICCKKPRRWVKRLLLGAAFDDVKDAAEEKITEELEELKASA